MSYLTTYDPDIQRIAAHRVPAWSWKRIKAQLIAESDLNTYAVSEAGAQGIAQFMPETFEQWRKILGYPAGTTPFDPIASINCCCGYMASLYAAWIADRTELDRWRLALASYNAGMGNIIKAQHAAKDASDYASIIAQLHTVTGEANAEQTIGYVARIELVLSELEAA